MANTTTAVLESLKYAYGASRVAYLFNQESPTWNILSRVKKPMGGRGQFILPIIVQNPGAFTGITEGGSLPSALDMDTAEATFSLQEYVAVYNVTWKLIQDSRNDKFAFQQAVQMLDDGLKRRVFKNLNSDLIGTGKGELFTITGADASTIVTSYYLPRVEKGMVVDVMDLTDDDAKVGDSLTVEAVDPIARTVDLSGALTGEAAGDYGVIQDTCDVTSNNPAYHSNGLLGIVDDANPAAVVGNYGGINRSTAGNEYWKSVVLSNSSVNRPLTEDLLLQALDASREKGGGKTSHILSNLAIVRRYHEMLAAERYFSLSQPGAIGGGVGRKSGMANGDDSKGDGKTPYEFSGIPWHVDPYFTNNVIVGLDSEHFFLGVGENDTPRPISEIFDNVPFFKQTTSATFEVNWYYQMELISDNPAAGWKIEDVAEA
jgi:hypothetical protein